MKRNYQIFKNRKGFLVTILILVFGLSTALRAQDSELSWTGAVDTDATNPLNWTPNLSVIDNFLTVDSAYKFTNLPVLSLTGTNGIRLIRVNNTGVFTIENAGDFLDINSGVENEYLKGTWNIQAGNVSVRKNLYMEDTMGFINLSGGSLECRSYLLMGDRNGVYGGYINLSGSAKLHCRVAPGRFSNDSTRSVITITEDAWVEVRGDWVSSAEYYIARNQITSDDNFDPYSYYDVDNALTIIDLRSKDELFMADNSTIQVLTDEIIPAVKVVDNRGFQSLTSKEWKYATVSGGPYVSFDPVQTGDSLYNASFSTAGNYFVVLEGTTGTGSLVSDEVQVAVTSPMVTLDPVNEQTIRVGWTGGMITATTMQAATSLEWKYSTTSGSGYVSFDPAITVNEYIPSFDAEGIYYVVCEAVVDGTTYSSPEVTIKMVARNATAQAITWTGAYSNDFSDNRNFSPMMHPWFNDVTVPSRDWLTNPPTLSTSGNDTIKSVWCYDSAQFVVNKPATDTLTFSGDTYQNGMLVVESGIIHYTGGYVRLDHKNAGVTLKGTSKFLHEFTGGFIMGNADDGARGGQVVIQDDAYMYVDHFWRWALDSLQSVITIRDNGLLELYKDKRSDVATRVARNQIKSDEGFIIQYALKVVGEDTTTVVTAKSEVAFDITPLTAQYIGVNSPSSTLSCVNDDNITSREWKYTTTSGTGYMSFNPAQTGATLEASFDAAGTYYVICEATDGNSTFVSDEAVLNVVSVEVTPADDQTIVVFEEGTTLTVAESLVPDTRDWKYSSTSGSGYAAFAPAERETTLDPLFFAEGVYYIVCVSVFDGNSITSNEVMITVTGELSDDASLSGIQLSVGELNPAFSSTTYTYAATLPSGTTTVTVTATPTDANATVAGDGDIDVSSGSGTANIVVTAQDGTTTQPYTVNFTVTGIELNKLEASVYPNPTSGRVFLDVANGGDFSVVVVDITGKAVLQQEFRNGNSIQEINLTNPGIYMLKIVKDDQILTEKVVVR